MTALPDASLPIEGSMTTVDVEGTAVAVVRVDGCLYAFQDACTHAACSLATGEIDGRHVVCPCHMGTFDVATGAVVSGPPKQPLRTWKVAPSSGGIELTS
jgi:nitrite reductase/ring-hydroxylating ferredoxin subunit